jgi:hypothetical protein
MTRIREYQKEMRRVARHTLSDGQPTGNGCFPRLDADTTQHVLAHLEDFKDDEGRLDLIYLHRLCMLKLVCKSVANACRRKLCEGTAEGFAKLIGAANVQLPVRAFLSVRENKEHRLRAYGRHEHWIDDAKQAMAHHTTVVVHALRIEAWFDGVRVTDEAFRYLVRRSCHGPSHASLEAWKERRRWHFEIPTFCVECPGVGIFHDPHDFLHALEEHTKHPYVLGENSTDDPLDLLLRLHPFLLRAGTPYGFVAATDAVKDRRSGSSEVWATNLAFLATSGRLV